MRTPSDTPHNQGVCHGKGGGVLGLLQGCNVLICGGMGGGAASAVQSAGIQPCAAAWHAGAEDAVKTFLEGKGNDAAGYCQCDITINGPAQRE